MAIKEPNIQITSQETRNKIKEISAFGLPNNPSAKGMSPDAIKKAFWAPIFAQGASLLEEMDRITTDINEYLSTVCQHIGNGDVESIDQEYQSFVKAGESGLTGLSNATWRVLKDLLERFNGQAQAIANQVAAAKGFADNAKEHAQNASLAARESTNQVEAAEDAAAAASASATTAADYAEYARNRANEANASATTANNSAAAAQDWFLKTEAAAAEAQKGMKLNKEMTCYVRINSSGNLIFGDLSYGSKIDEFNRVWLGSYTGGVSDGQNTVFPGLKEIFECKLVEILITDDENSNLIGDKILYQERTGGSKLFDSTKYIETHSDYGQTRLIYWKAGYEQTSFTYSLKLAKGLAYCLQTISTYKDATAVPRYPIIPVIFRGYN